MAYVIAALLLVIFTAPAHAYIDPGSGSYMLQVSLAGLLAVLFSLKLFWKRLKASVVARLTSPSRTRDRRHA